MRLWEGSRGMSLGQLSLVLECLSIVTSGSTATKGDWMSLSLQTPPTRCQTPGVPRGVVLHEHCIATHIHSLDIDTALF